MKTETDRILSRVRKLLALAADAGATEGERDNAMRMAHATLAKHNLDMAAVESASGQKVQGEDRVRHGEHFYGRPWARLVCDSIGELFFCRYLFLVATKAKHTHHLFFGRKSNATTAALMAKFVVESVIREASKRQRERGEGNAWKRSFCMGAAIRIRQRVTEMLAEATTPRKGAAKTAAAADAAFGKGTAPGTEIALATIYENEMKANMEFVEQELGRKPKERGGGSSNYVGGAAIQGARFGDTINLSRQLNSDGGVQLQLEHK